MSFRTVRRGCWLKNNRSRVAARLASESEREKHCQTHIIAVALGSSDGSVEPGPRKVERKTLVVEACHSYELCNLKRSLLNLRQRADGWDRSCGEGARSRGGSRRRITMPRR